VRCEPFTMSGNNHEKIRSIVEFCSCNEGTAIKLLQAANFDVQAAVLMHLSKDEDGLDDSRPVLDSAAAPSSAVSPPPAPAALKKTAHDANFSNWVGPVFLPDAQQAAINASAEASAGRALDGRQVKFDEASIGTNGGGASGSRLDVSSSGSGPLGALDHNLVGANAVDRAAAWGSAPLQSQPRDSEGRVKRARPDMSPGQPDPSEGFSTSAHANGGKRGSLRFAEGESQESGNTAPMQLDTPPSEPGFDASTNFANAALQDPALAGLNAWDDDALNAGQVVPYADNRGRRPPSPPPRREAESSSGAAISALPPNEDYDLERALQASLEDQKGGGAIDEDDPELAAAIQASMTDAGMMDSWYSTGSAGFGSKGGRKDGQPEAGKVPDHLVSLKRKEHSKAPTTLAAPFESLRLFPLILHALYALPPIRRGFETFEIERLSSVNDLTNFWTGVSAGKKSNPLGLGKYTSADEREKADVIQRLQILFLFMDRTYRPFCMTGSVLEVLPQSLMTLNSGAPDPADLAMYTISSLFDAYRIAVRAIAGRHSDNQEDWIADKTRIFDTLVAYGIPPPRADTLMAEEGQGSSTAEQPPLVMPTPQNSPLTTFSSTHLDLRHTATVNDMASAVLTVLEADAALVTVPGDTLCVGIKHDVPAPSSPGVGIGSSGSGKGKAKEGQVVGDPPLRPWRVEKHFYADPFLWDRRRGLAHGQALDEADRMEELKRKREEQAKRKQRRKWLAAPDGRDALALLNDSIAYFEGPGQQTEDRIRTQTSQEAAARLTHIRDHLQSQIAVLDEVIAATDESIASNHRERLDRFRQTYEGKPEWQRVRYDLRAILIQAGEAAWAYVQHQGQWFRIQNGHVHVTDEGTALGDESGAGEVNGGVFFLAYLRADAMDGMEGILAEFEERKRQGVVSDDDLQILAELLEHGVEGPPAVPASFGDAIDADNAEFEAMLMSLPAENGDGSEALRASSKNNKQEQSSSSGSHGDDKEEDDPDRTQKDGNRMSVIAEGLGHFDSTNINLSGLLKEQHENRADGGSPRSDVVEIGLPD